MMTDPENPHQSMQSGRSSQVAQAPPVNSVQRSSMQSSMQSKPNDPYSSQQSRSVAPSGEYSSRGPPQPEVDPQTASNRFYVIVFGILVVICLGVAAIVLPFALDSDCNCPDVPNISGPIPPSTTPVPTPSPTVPPGTPTASPTRAGNVSDRFSQFVDNYASDISGDEVFEDAESPQFRAAQFIADDAEFEVTNLDQLGDLYAVAVFYYSTNGDEWTQCSQGSSDCDGVSWLSTESNYCNWNWINCNDDGRVVDIVFTNADGNNLSGPLHLELGLLTELSQFVAVNNKISGSFPVEFGQLTNVTRVILASNSMNGTLPDDFLVNSPLEIFMVTDNDFSGNIPQSFSEISTLSQLLLANNQFSGIIPEGLGSLPNLGTLDLTGNRLIGIIPDALYSGIIENMYLGGNQQLTGSISSAIGDATSLVRLRITDTLIEGELPEGIFLLPLLEELDLTNNGLSGTLSASVVNLGDTLRTLMLDGNNFSGDLPSSAIDELTISNILTFDRNSFSGSISSVTCARIGDGRDQLQELTVDCEEVSCSCCTNCA